MHTIICHLAWDECRLSDLPNMYQNPGFNPQHQIKHIAYNYNPRLESKNQVGSPPQLHSRN